MNTFGEINLKGPGADGATSSVGLTFTFKNRDTNAEVTIPWMQFTLFDFDRNNDNSKGQEVPRRPPPPASRPPPPALRLPPSASRSPPPAPRPPPPAGRAWSLMIASKPW